MTAPLKFYGALSGSCVNCAHLGECGASYCGGVYWREAEPLDGDDCESDQTETETEE